MVSDARLGISMIVPPSSVCHCASIRNEIDGEELIAFAISSTVSSPREHFSQVSLEGAVQSLVAVDGGFKVLAIERFRGVDDFIILSVPGLKEVFRSGSGFPEGYGALLESPMVSNECGDMVVYQNKEGSLHVISSLSSERPKSEVFHLTKTCSILPSRSLALIARGPSQYFLLMIAGDEDLNTELRLLDLSVDEGNISLNRVVNLPGGLSQIQKEIRPYRVCVHEKERTLLFIGGDSTRYSMLCTVPFSEIEDTRKKESAHCEPLPGALAVSVVGGFLIASRFGELYSLPIKNATRLSLVADQIPPVSCLAFLHGSTSLFLGSAWGDSLLLSFEKNKVSDTQIVIAGTAPILAFGDKTRSDTITCVSGLGSSASLNRIKISGIGTRLLNGAALAGLSAAESLFLVRNGRILIISNSLESHAFSVSASGSAERELRELTSSGFPPSLIAVFEPSDSRLLGVTNSAIWEFTPTREEQVLSSKKVCSVVDLTCCAYSDEAKSLVLGSGRKILRFNGKECVEFSKFPDDLQEISCLAFSGTLLAVGEWGGTVRLFDQTGKLVHAIYARGKIPRNIKFHTNPKTFLIGYSDGTISVLDSEWRSVIDNEHCGFAGSIWPIVTGDRPSMLVVSEDNKLRLTELVDVTSGTVIPMRSAVLSEEGYVWFINREGSVCCCFMKKEKTRESHVQRAFLFPSPDDSFPVAVALLESHGLIATAITTVSSDPDTDDEIVFHDQFQLNKVSCFRVGEKFRLSCLAPFGDSLLVGTGKDSSHGKLIQLVRGEEGNSWVERCSSLVLAADGSPAGPVGTVSVCDEWIVVTCLRQVIVLKIKDACILHAASIDADLLCVSLDAVPSSEGLSVLVGDLYRSCSLFHFEFSSSSLALVARDSFPSNTTAVSLLGEYAIMGDESGNLYGMKLVEPSLGRFERIEGVNIASGSSISAIKRVSPNCCWVATREGAICLLELVEDSPDPMEVEDTRASSVGWFDSVFEPRRMSAPPSVRHQIQSVISSAK